MTHRWVPWGVCVLALAPGCRWRPHHAHHAHSTLPRNPRQVWATSCDDARFVATPPLLTLGTPDPTATVPHPFTAARVGIAGDLRVAGTVVQGTVQAVVRGHPGTVTVGTGASGDVAAVATDRAVVVAYTVAPQGLALAFVTPDGRVTAFPGARPDGAVIADGRAPSLAVGDGTLAVFYEAAVPWGQALFVARYDAVTGARAMATVPVDGPRVTSPSIAWASHRFALGWASGDHVRFTTLAPTSMHLQTTVDLVTVGAPVDHVALAGSDRRVAVAWSDRREGVSVLYSTAVDAVTRRGSGAQQRLSVHYDPGAQASLAWDGGAFGVAWWEPVTGGVAHAYLALLDQDGNRMGTQMRVRVPEDMGVQDVSLTWTGKGYLYGYTRSDATMEARQTGPRGCDEEP